MIPYEELCQALDRFNRRLQNEAEMDSLEAIQEDDVDADHEMEVEATVISGAPFMEEVALDGAGEHIIEPTVENHSGESTQELDIDDAEEVLERSDPETA